MSLRLERATRRLPIGFAELEADAEADGRRHMTRLAAEFAQTSEMFHAVFACFLDDGLAGIGAITDEPASTAQPAWRMRRLYVHRGFRRQGVARTIATTLLREAAGRVDVVTVHAGNPDAAQFWQAIGFAPVTGSAWSHEVLV
jgi:GNAT superfamily N-acetyltransferase